jgi:hypothetical protein
MSRKKSEGEIAASVAGAGGNPGETGNFSGGGVFVNDPFFRCLVDNGFRLVQDGVGIPGTGLAGGLTKALGEFLDAGPGSFVAQPSDFILAGPLDR